MNILPFNRKTIILLALIIAIPVMLILLLVTGFKDKQGLPSSPAPVPQASFRPSPSISQPELSNKVGPNTDPALKQKYETDQANQDKFVESRERIGQLITTLPFSGKYFTLSYNIQNNKFTLAIDQNNKALGTSEFTQYLESKGIDKQYMDIVIINK